MIACLASVESLALVYSTRNLSIKVLSWQLHGRHFVDQILSVTTLAPLTPGTKVWDKPKHRSSKTVGSSESSENIYRRIGWFFAQSCQTILQKPGPMETPPCPTNWSNNGSDWHQTRTLHLAELEKTMWRLQRHKQASNQGTSMTATWKTLSGQAAFLHNLAPLVPRAQCRDKPEHRSSKTPLSSTILQKVSPWNAGMPNKMEQPSIWFPPNTDCMYWQKWTTFVNTSRTAPESRCYHGSYMEDTLWTKYFQSQP